MANITVDVRKDFLQGQASLNAHELEAVPTKFAPGIGNCDYHHIKFACQTCTITEAAKMLSVSVSTVYRLIDIKGRYYNPSFPKPIYVSPGRRVFIVLEIMEYLER